MNKVKFKGKIVDIFNGPRVSSVTLMVKNNGKISFPTIRFTGYKNSEPGKFKRGDIVSIDGSYRAYAKKEPDGERRKFIQYAKGKQIEYINDNYAEMFDLKTEDESACNQNEVIIEGRVISHHVTKNAVNLLITPTHDTVSIWVKVRTNEPYTITDNYPVGTILRATGEVKTFKKPNQKRPEEFIKVLNLAKVENDTIEE